MQSLLIRAPRNTLYARCASMFQPTRFVCWSASSMSASLHASGPRVQLFSILGARTFATVQTAGVVGCGRDCGTEGGMRDRERERRGVVKVLWVAVYRGRVVGGSGKLVVEWGFRGRSPCRVSISRESGVASPMIFRWAAAERLWGRPSIQGAARTRAVRTVVVEPAGCRGQRLTEGRNMEVNRVLRCCCERVCCRRVRGANSRLWVEAVLGLNWDCEASGTGDGWRGFCVGRLPSSWREVGHEEGRSREQVRVPFPVLPQQHQGPVGQEGRA